jgi:hypothetical protein
MADTSWEYVIPGAGTYNDTSQDFEPVVPGVGTVNEGATAAPGGWTHKWNTIAAANMAKINTIPKANIAKINTI